MNQNIKRRGERVTGKQKKIIVEFMQEHDDFAMNKLLDVEGKITSHNLWLVLCERLNACGPQKSLAKWQRVWTDIKIKVRRKASGIAYRRLKRGRWPPEQIVWDDIDDQVMEIIKKYTAKGHLDSNTDPLESEEPVSVSQIIAKDVPLDGPRRRRRFPEPAPPFSINIPTQIKEEEEERVTATEQINNNCDPLMSPLYSEIDSTSSSIPQQIDRRKTSVDEIQELNKRSTQALQDVAAELKNLNGNVNALISQNELLMAERKNTNSILLRIAKSLERSE